MARRVPLASCIMETRRSLSIVALLLASACSGATSTELFDQVGSDSVPAAPIVGRDDPTDGTSSSSSSSSGGTSSSSSSSSTSSSGSSGAPQPGATPDAGAPPAPPGCVAEVEPNEGPAQTNWFTACFTGSVKRDDHDYASISAPVNAKRIDIKHTESGGDVQYRIYINDVAYQTFENDPPDFIPVFGGATYSFEMSASGNRETANRTYQLDVTFQ
jgi:hypothetical protein